MGQTSSEGDRTADRASSRIAPQRRRRFLPSPAAAALGLVLIGACVIAWGAIAGDPTRHIMQRRSALGSWRESADSVAGGYHVVTTRVQATSGLAFDMAIKWPVEDSTAAPSQSGDSAGGSPGRIKRPLVLILGGQQAGYAAANLIHDTKGAIVAALSYPNNGRPWPWSSKLILELPRIRGTLLDTPAAIMLALDYVKERGTFDIETVDLVGVSLGVPFVTIAAALDERFDRVWSIHGAGEPYTLIEHNLRRWMGFAPVRKVAAVLANAWTSGPAVAPEKWVARISPRPFLMINALDDQNIPRTAAMTLYESAREPKELHWMQGPHVTSAREETIRELVEMIFARVSRGAGN